MTPPIDPAIQIYRQERQRMRPLDPEYMRAIAAAERLYAEQSTRKVRGRNGNVHGVLQVVVDRRKRPA